MPYNDKNKANQYLKEWRKNHRETENEKARKAKWNRRWEQNNPGKKQEYDARYRDNHPGRNAESCRKHRKAWRSTLIDIKLFYGCMNPACGWIGELPSGLLDFHHVDPNEKEKTLTRSMSREKRKAEINKCIVLCANCHRLVHYHQLDCSAVTKCEVDDDFHPVRRGQ